MKEIRSEEIGVVNIRFCFKDYCDHITPLDDRSLSEIEINGFIVECKPKFLPTQQKVNCLNLHSF